MSEDHSVTMMIAKIKAGTDDSKVHQAIWDRYFFRLAQLAKTKLRHLAVVDGEDVALSALNSFFDRAPKGQFSRLSDREELWPLLAQIATNKAINEFKKQTAEKRGGGKVRGESVFALADVRGRLDEFIEGELTPEFADETFLHIQDLLELIEQEDKQLLKVALLKLQGYSAPEIAKELGCVRRTVERKVEMIRSVLEREM